MMTQSYLYCALADLGVFFIVCFKICFLLVPREHFLFFIFFFFVGATLRLSWKHHLQ